MSSAHMFGLAAFCRTLSLTLCLSAASLFSYGFLSTGRKDVKMARSIYKSSPIMISMQAATREVSVDPLFSTEYMEHGYI
jgi:hypothetical protein